MVKCDINGYVLVVLSNWDYRVDEVEADVRLIRSMGRRWRMDRLWKKGRKDVML